MTEPAKRTSGKAPISAHPAFPAIVALWFAALMGIGSLVLPVALFENLAVASGLSSVVAAAQPPLGVTARILIALAAAGVGIAAGLAIARRVTAAASMPAPVRNRQMSPAAVARASVSATKRPLSIRDEVTEDGIADDDDRQGARRRSLTIADENARSEFLDMAPLPGDDLVAPAAEMPAPEMPAPEMPAPEISSPVEPQAVPADALDLASFDMPFEAAETPSPVRQEFRPATEPQPFAAAAPVEPAPVATPAMNGPTSEIALTQLVERFAQALQQHRDKPVAAPAVMTAPEPEAEVVAPLVFSPRASLAASAAPVMSPAPVESASDEPVPGEQAPAMAPIQFTAHVAPAPAAPAVPAALRSIRFDLPDEDEDEEAFAPLDLSASFLRPAVAAVAVPDDESAEADDDAAAADSYPSLLAMRASHADLREPVRIDDTDDLADDGADAAIEPVVVFPGQGTRRPVDLSPAAPAAVEPSAGPAPFRPFDAPLDRVKQAAGGATAASRTRADAGDTERALRDALEKLQKMSGAA